MLSFRLFSESGEAISLGTPLWAALQSPTKILIDNYLYSVPALAAGDIAPSEGALGDTHLRSLLERTTAALQAHEAMHAKRQEAHARLCAIEDKLKPLDAIRTELEEKGERAGHRMAWGGLGLMGVQFGLLARLTWWDYSWDIMEPVTYFVGSGTTMALFAYYVLTRQELSGRTMTDRKILKTLYKDGQQRGLNVEEYNRLVEEAEKAQREVQGLQ